MEVLTLIQTKNEIAEQIKHSIFAGGFQPGQELTQEFIAQKLGVSRMPVREAFQLLQEEGVLLRLPNRHLRVVEFTPERVRQTFRALADLEVSLLLLLQEQGCLAGLSESISQCLAALENCPEALPAAELKFHQTISEALGNIPLRQAHHHLLGGFFSYALERQSAQGSHTPRLRALLSVLQGTWEENDLRAALGQYYQDMEIPPKA